MIIKKIELESKNLANCYLLTDEKTGKSAVVDPGYCGKNLKEAISGIEKNIDYIILTHGHFDHIVGAYGLKELTGAKVLIHALDEKCLWDEEESLNSTFPDTAAQTPMKADRLLEDGDEIILGGSRLTVLHTPGHTAGSICLIDYEGKNIISGDTLFKYTVGRTDFKGGSDEKMKESIEKLIALPGDFNVYPGHNIATTLDSERTRNFYIRHITK